jgi:Arc/MetJ-type ribon-helix-helix transcriptional regulator
MSTKQRLSVTVDPDLVAAAEAAVAAGEADNVSAWVTDAMRLKVDSDARLQALAAALGEFEREHGKITDDEMAGAAREARRRAVVIRGTRAGEPRKRYGR